ncbi:MAG: hypothetical protein P8076_15110 [Gammaproteobacteria bacterium]
MALWAGWYSLVVITNAADALKALAILPADWPLASQNFRRIREATAVYNAPPWLDAVLFAGVIIWQSAGAVLFWLALAHSVAGHGVDFPHTNLAFTVALALWGAFILAEEIFKQYRAESSHLLLFLAQLLSLLALHLLPG